MLIATLLIFAAAVYLMIRRVDVRLVLIGAGLAMSLLVWQPLAIADTFTTAMVASLVAPICAAMGFAMVVTVTGCDKHLVHLLLKPLRRVRFLLLPGGVLAAYFVNMAIPSQASTAAALGPVLVPLLLASGYTAVVAGAALVLGASFGGDLLNPAGTDIQAIVGTTGLSAPELSRRIIPASLAGASVATLIFTALNYRPAGSGLAIEAEPALPPDKFRINPLKAIVPLVPITLLILAFAGVPWLAWLVAVPDSKESARLANAFPVVRAMLIGCVVAVAVSPGEISRVTKSFFDGMGAAYANIISLTIAAQCFVAGISAVGLDDMLLDLARHHGFLELLAAAFPWALATVSGSGTGPIVAFAEEFLSKMPGDEETAKLAALSCFGGSAGRTMSPVAAVVVYTSGLVGVSPVLLVSKVVPGLVAGAVVAMLVALR